MDVLERTHADTDRISKALESRGSGIVCIQTPSKVSVYNIVELLFLALYWFRYFGVSHGGAFSCRTFSLQSRIPCRKFQINIITYCVGSGTGCRQGCRVEGYVFGNVTEFETQGV